MLWQRSVGDDVPRSCNRVTDIIWDFFGRIRMFGLLSTVRSPVVTGICFRIGYAVQH